MRIGRGRIDVISALTIDADIPMATYKLTGLGAGSEDGHSLQYQQAILQSLLTVQGDIIVRGASVAGKLAKITTGKYLKATATGYEGGTPPAPTKEFFVHPSEKAITSIGAAREFHTGYILDGAAEQVFFEFHIPHDFTSITEAVLVVLAESTGTHRINLRSDYCASGEAYNTHSETDLDVDTVVVNTKLYEIDVSGVLASIAVGDFVGINILGDATNTPDWLVLGIRFKYS